MCESCFVKGEQRTAQFPAKEGKIRSPRTHPVWLEAATRTLLSHCRQPPLTSWSACATMSFRTVLPRCRRLELEVWQEQRSTRNLDLVLPTGHAVCAPALQSLQPPRVAQNSWQHECMRHMAARMGFAVIIARVTVTMWLLVFQFDRLVREVHNDSPKAKVPPRSR